MVRIITNSLLPSTGKLFPLYLTFDTYANEFFTQKRHSSIVVGGEIIKRFRDLVNRSFHKNGLDISYDQWMVINTIYKKQGVTQIYVAEQTRKEPASVSRILKLLEKKEIIERVDDRKNKRAKRLYLTPKGDDVHSRATRLFNMIAKDGFNGVYEQEINLFVRILDKVQSNFNSD